MSVDPGEGHQRVGRPFQRARGEDDEEIRLETGPIDLTERRDHAVDRDTLDIPDQRDRRASTPSSSARSASTEMATASSELVPPVLLVRQNHFPAVSFSASRRRAR